MEEMKTPIAVLFVSSGTKHGSPSPIVKCQGESLKNAGISISYFTINRKGIIGYLRESFNLRRYIRNNKIRIIHAHYGLSAIVALFAKKGNVIVVSFMGTDLLGFEKQSGKITGISKLFAFISKILAQNSYDHCIVKSKQMKEILAASNVSLIPNGVNMKMFYPISKYEAVKHLNLSHEKKLIIFVSNPLRREKNFKLAEKAIEILGSQSHKLVIVNNILQEKLIYYYNAADALVLTSFHEGSPNVIKEAMACNCPLVSTDVGDVKEIIKDVEGCYLSSFDPNEFAAKTNLALEFANSKGRTKGRDRILKLGLDTDSIAEKVIKVYNSTLSSYS